jgi:hypothetical protein
MDLVTLIAACALSVEPKAMHALIWEQSGGEPWSFSVPDESLPRVLPTIQDAIRKARATRPNGGRIRVGLTGLSADPRSVTAVLFAPCPNITLAARQITRLAERCKTTSKPDPIYCAIAAYRGSWDRPDTRFAGAVRATVEKGNAPNFDMRKDAYFDAGDIASETPTRSARCSDCATANTRRSSARLGKWIVSRDASKARQHIVRGAKRRSSCRRAAFAKSCNCSASSKQSTSRQSVCAEVIRAEAVMSLSVLLRRISDRVARLTVRPWGGGHPTARWQDKSRKLRRGRSVEERKHFKHVARGATAHDSLPLRTTPWKFTTTRTSPAPTP